MLFRTLAAIWRFQLSLVQTYVELNGYFTSAEYPIIASERRNGVRTITDIDILAFRFPSASATSSI
jgi:hypothetical protein